MSLLYSPPGPHGHHYYDAAQLAAFGVYVALLLGQGYRRGYPARAWLPLVAASTLALVLGCQLVCLPLAAWPGWLRGDAAALAALADGGRSVVGGAWGVFLVVLALRRPLGFRGWGVLDAFAGPLCWALAVQCVGCGLAGCCWGEATAGTWGVVYGPGTPAYAAQVAAGLVPAGAAHSLPLVPTQLLQLLACAGAGLALHLLRRRAAAWPAGSGYLLGTGLLCLGRLAVEAWRDPAGEPLLGAALSLAGVSLRGLQWLMLAEVLVLLGGWAWWVRRAARPVPAPAPHPAAPALMGLGLLVATARLASATLAPAEVLALQLLLLLVLLAEARTWLVTLGRGLPRLAGLPLAAVLGGALLLAVAQAPAPETAKPKPEPSLTISGGYLGSDHDANGYFGDGSGCGRGEQLALQQQVRAVGVEVAREQVVGTGRLTLGGGLWVGQQRIEAQDLSTVSVTRTMRYSLVDAHAYVEANAGHDWTTLGVRFGAHAGDLGHYSYFNDDASTQAAVFVPEMMFRIGHPRLLFAQVDAGYGAENALGSYANRLALGSGLGLPNNSNLLLGYASAAHYPTPGLAFASANLRLPARTGLSLEPYFATDFGRHNLFSVKLHCRLGGK